MTVMQKVLKNSKKGSAGKSLRILATTCSAAALLWTASAFTPAITPAHAESVAAQNTEAAQSVEETAVEDIQKITYDIYAGGIHAVRVDMDVIYDDDREDYKLEMRAFTRGFLGKLVPWKGSFMTEGWHFADSDTEQPKLHQSISTWREDTEIKRFTYGKDGTFKGLSIEEEGVDKSPKNLTDDLTEDTVDAMTASLKAMKKVGNGEDCAGESDVFDGKRRFTMKFEHEGTETVKPTRYNVYNGEATRCVVEVVPGAGAWHKKPRGWLSIQEQGRQKGSLPTIWMAKITEDAPAVPVKLRLKTQYGTLFMHMTEYQSGDKLITSLDD